MDVTELWLSAKELAALSRRGLRMPGSERGCRNLAKREAWPSKEVQGKGGPGGLLTLYRPPDAVLATIAAIDGGTQQPPPRPALAYSSDSAKGAPHKANEPPFRHIEQETLCDILRLLEDELARKHAVLDPSRKAEVVTLLYEEAIEEPDRQRRKERILRLVSLVA